MIFKMKFKKNEISQEKAKDVKKKGVKNYKKEKRQLIMQKNFCQFFLLRLI